MSDVNGELPTTILDNGNEATVIAGKPNPHLSVRHAVECTIARSYFVQAYSKLNVEDRDALIKEHTLEDLAIITALVVDDLSSFSGRIGYAAAGDLENVQLFIEDIQNRVDNQIGETEEANLRYAEVLYQRHEKYWKPLLNNK